MPNRTDYKTRKEYRWAKKIEKRKSQKEASPFIFGFFLAGIIVWFVAGAPLGLVVFFGGAILAGIIQAIKGEKA